MDLVVATRNRGKFREIVAILSDWPGALRSLEDFPDLPEAAEDGATLAENALQKARWVAAQTGLPALADDSGLEVEALQGAPGVHSARFGGPGLTDAERNALLLERLQGVPPEQRRARFRCVVALALPDGRAWSAEGTCEGQIALEPVGTHGFGYDPLFEVAGQRRTMAELPPEVKNTLSHRAQALRLLRQRLAGQGQFLPGKP
jgi:XTP/dITP diphosphohydrolase